MARHLLMTCEDLEVTARYVLHDRDALLIHDFGRTLGAAGTAVVKTPLRAPDANAHAERWVRSMTGECLDHLVLFGLSSLRRALSTYCGFFNGHRPHQGLANRIPDRQTAGDVQPIGGAAQGEVTIGCEQFLGGLLKSYSREAA